jgi:glycosyltransferase involved in cell wall biosynthesis
MDRAADPAVAASGTFLDQVTPLILTWNEAPNIGRVLERLRWARRIVVVDSGSSDATVAIAQSHPNVEVCTRAFDSHARQWSFGLEKTGIETEWVLALDADYLLSPALVEEIAALRPTERIAGYTARFRYAIHGHILSGSLYPPVSVLFRRDRARYVQDGHTQRVVLDGDVEWLSNPIVHDDRKPLSRWLAAQARYAESEARHLIDTPWRRLGWADRVRRLIVIAPWLVPVYCLVVKRGLLDGLPGWYYALHRGVAEAVLSLKLIEARLGMDAPPGKEH